MLYTLHYKDYTAIADSHGGELISFQNSTGTEYLWNGNPKFWSGHSPHLFPIIGTTKHDSGIPKHGFIRTSKLTPEIISPSEIRFTLTDTDETQKVYPYSFHFNVTHKLTKQGFITTYSVKNTGSNPMPYCLGGHVGFACPLFPNESFSDYELNFDTQSPHYAQISTTDAPLNPKEQTLLISSDNSYTLSYSMFENGAIIIDHFPDDSIRLRNPATGNGIELFFPEFPVLALWTMPHKSAPYLCIEPWHGLPAQETDGDSLFEKPYVIILEPGETRNTTIEMRLLQDK